MNWDNNYYFKFVKIIVIAEVLDWLHNKYTDLQILITLSMSSGSTS